MNHRPEVFQFHEMVILYGSYHQYTNLEEQASPGPELIDCCAVAVQL